jgi:gliding motility-associated-like protein
MCGKRYYLFLTFLFFAQFAQGQLSNFTLNVTKRDETCTSNGTLTFSVSNTTAGATMLYSIFLLPNTTTPISVQSATSISGLSAGNYNVLATQSLGNLSGSQQQNITIENLIVPLTYQISSSDEVCGNDGRLTVNVITGSFLNCEIFAGPMTRPLQTSTTFNGLVAGQYSIRVFDACNNGVVQTYTVSHKTPGLIITTVYSNAPSNCTTANVHQLLSHSSSTAIAYPLAVQYIVNPPSGGTPIVFNQTVLYSPFYDPQSVDQDIPLFPNQNYTYDVRVTDACGNIYTNNGNIVNSSTMPVIYQFNGNCNSLSFSIYNALSATIITAPSSYPNPIPHNLPNDPQNNLVFIANDLTPGFYSFNVIDVCGVAHVLNNMIGNQPEPIPPSIRVGGGCQIGFRTVTISSIVDLSTVIIVSAPGSFQQAIPYNFSFGITPESSGYFVSGDLPEGDYVFRVVTECGYSYDFPIYVDGYYMSNAIDVIENCGSFDISLFHTSNNLNAVPSFWLQKYNPISNQWEHPLTGVTYPINSAPNTLNSVALNNNAVNFNFTASGYFRIIRSDYDYQAGTIQPILCITVLKEFDYYGQPRINKVYTFACANGKYDAIVDAVGIGNLIYRITLKNGTPFLVENGTNNVFLQLDPATYNFQVEDSCGNISNVLLDVPTPFIFEITSSHLCQGEAGVLTIPNFSFLTYQWWKDSSTTTILSTTNSLNFSSFNSASDNGIYHVRITYLANLSSCLNQVLDYEILIDNTLPQAGNDNAVSYCGRQGIIDMGTLLTGNFEPLGTWAEITSSGMLTTNLWDSSTVLFGTYRFKYTVSGTCGVTDDALITITIKAIPHTPTASADPIVCETQNVNLFATFVASGVYNWTGPNGFTSTLQNPILNSFSNNDNGIYTVSASLNGCQSENSSVEVLVNPLPSFALNQDCIGKEYQVWYTRLNDVSFDETNSTFSWTGPNNFTSNSSPITITGSDLGVYFLKITNQFGCEVTNSIDVVRNICFIPNVITPNNDGTNDALDLTGFGVDKLEIYNRWGRKVYEKSNYLKEWHGQNMSGGLLPDSTYFYIITLSTKEIKNGWIFLNRG